MNDRPAIPRAVRRQVLLQARHRCAACCKPTALEFAHIVPWHKTQDHSESNLVTLCATCHTLSHQDGWDTAMLLYYKRNPCALERERNRFPPMSGLKKAIVDWVISADPDEMTEKDRLALISMVAAYLEVPFSDIRILSVTPAKSSRVRCEMPYPAAQRLIDGFRRRDPELFAFLRELSPEAPDTYVKDIHIVDVFALDSFWSKLRRLVAFALPGSLEPNITVEKNAVRAVMAVAATSLAIVLLGIPVAEFQIAGLRQRELAIDRARATLLVTLSANEQLRGDSDAALKFAVLGANLELDAAVGSPRLPLARMQLASLVAQSTRILTPQTLPTRIRLARLSADAAFLFTFSDDRTARIWDTATGKEVAAAELTESMVTAAAFNSDGSKVAMAKGDGTMTVWAPATGAERTILADNRARLTATQFSPDGQRLALGSEDGTVRLVELATETVVEFARQSMPVLDTAFNTDGSLLVIASEQGARIWNLATREPTADLRTRVGCSSVTFS